MTHPTGTKLFAVGVLLTLLSASLMSLPPRHAAKGLPPSRESRKGVNVPLPDTQTPDTQTPEQMPDVVLAAPYWSTADGFVSTIEMKNYHVSKLLTVTPVLRLERGGGDITLTPVTLKPSETRQLNINTG